MSRGPYPKRTLALALPIAAIRGTVHMIRPARGTLYDIVISTAVPVAFVRVRYADRILLTLANAEDFYYEAITGLRAIVSTENISRELWLRSRHSTWRFFRVMKTCLVEISRDGTLLT